MEMASLPSKSLQVVRYLQDNGTMVQEGEAYVELEAMKMIMPIKATGTGKVSHLRGAGSIVSAGELLGTLELKDPSKVKKIVPFEGQLRDLHRQCREGGSMIWYIIIVRYYSYYCSYDHTHIYINLLHHIYYGHQISYTGELAC